MFCRPGRKAIQDVQRSLTSSLHQTSYVHRFITTGSYSEERQRSRPSRQPVAHDVPPKPHRRPASISNETTNKLHVEGRKLLRPYNLALQLKRLAAEENLDGAIERLQSTPRDAQNTAVWNTMLSLCIQAQRYQLAYQLFIDMKRRGFSPNCTTYTTMLKGFGQVTEWSTRHKQLEHAHTLYAYYMKHVESAKYHDPDNVQEISTAPLVAYINILGHAGQHQKMFDVYFAMDQEGPLAPDRYVFTAMLRAIANCLQNTPPNSDEKSIRNIAASDAKYVWLQVQKTMRKQPEFTLDSQLITSAIRALTFGRPSDQQLAFDIAAEHLGLTKPGDRTPPQLYQHINCWTLDAALFLCLHTQKPRLCVHFLRFVMERLDLENPGMRQLITRSQTRKALLAHSTLAGLGSPNESAEAIRLLEWCLERDAIYDIPALRPDYQTYHLVLLTCYRNTDWAGALHIFQLMTGIQVGSLRESDLGKKPPEVQRRPEGRNLRPTAETMSFIMRTAIGTTDWKNHADAMWIAYCIGVDKLLENEETDVYYRGKLARAITAIAARLLEDDVYAKHHQWLTALRLQAEGVIRNLGHVPVPEVEKGVLGSLATLNGAGDFDVRSGGQEHQNAQVVAFY
ncbi:hypothetical protein F5I97DRAFT_1862492 [Phlebopus sp. FC_14]|nr:hypothetical protein F5I97DRAFT_1862492 [Phlebopus sp. FC_14]